MPGADMMYQCHLCGIASLTANTLASHAVAMKHRKHYLMIKHPKMYKDIGGKGEFVDTKTVPYVVTLHKWSQNFKLGYNSQLQSRQS